MSTYSVYTPEAVVERVAPTTRERRGLQAAALALIFLVVFVGSLFRPALLDDADATHAEAAREMAATGDFVTLHVNGIRYLEKAPLIYWISALSMRAFGVSAAAARAPIIVGVLLIALLTWRWSVRAFGQRAGSYAALFTLTAAGVYLFTRVLIPEVLLSAFIGAALYFFLTALEPSARAWRWYAGYAATALAVLTKGLVALVFVGGVAGIFLAITNDWRRWREFRLGTGLLVFFAIAAPWHVLAGVRNRGFFWFYFVNEHILRFLGRRYPKDYNKLPALAYWTLHLAWLFPWSFFVPTLVRDSAARLRERNYEWDFSARTRLLCWIWAGLVLIFFAVSTNQEYYTFPAYVPLMMLAAAALAHSEIEQEDEQADPSALLLGPHAALVAIGATIAVLLGTGLWASRHLPFVPDIGSVMAERGVGGYTLSMSHFFDLTTESFAGLRLPAALAAIAFGIGPLVALLLRVKRRHLGATWAVGATMALFLFAAHLALARFEPYLSSRPLAEAIAHAAQVDDRIMIYGDQAYGSSLLFYLQRPIYLVNGRTTSMAFGSQYPDAPKIFLDDAALKQAWASSARVLLFVPPERFANVRAILPNAKVFAESSGKRILTNKQ